MTLIKTGLLNGIAVLIKMLTLLGINKVLAIYVGPAGYAALGQFQNAVQMITVFSSGAINTGVTKYTAQYHADEAKQRKVWKASGTIALIGSIFTAVIIVCFKDSLADFFLNDRTLSSVFVWFASTLVFFTMNTLLLAILNGKKEIVAYVVANIAGSVFALLVTIGLTIYFGLYGALVALAVYQSLSFFITLYLCTTTKWFKFHYLFGRVDKATALDLSKYTAMALTSTACIPICQIFIRDYIGESISWDAAGYWEAMWRLSAAYLMLMTTTLSVYYLPRLSEIVGVSDIRKEIINGYKVILPITIFAALMIYMLRDFIVHVLFSSEFLPMRELFGWQVIGDVMKICSWLFAYVMLGKAMFKLFMVTEVFFSITLYVLTRVFCDRYGLVGTAMAYTLNYFCYWVVIAICVNYTLKSTQKNSSDLEKTC
ncbi:O-antigen translocase [Pseudomonas saxonica]|uniref:O-antigen translocase n=1 Tax=Pseudomonas saxonica TaxID=2600598 RepID=A0A5C5PWV5_9PSED|nr:O-antigen translocase [Pseudomonas saxonica]TWR94135.1 O-antigen translocase [Pseudomonas saxonica]